MLIGKIEEGSLKGRRVILEPRNSLPDNEYLVEEGTFLNGEPKFARYCLVCCQQAPNNGCQNCK